MRYYNSRQDSKTAVYDHYTGVGEVLAIHALDDAFGTLGRKIRVKRGSLFSLDDVRNNNLIFVALPQKIFPCSTFRARRNSFFKGWRRGRVKAILRSSANIRSRARPGTYLASPSNAPLTEDYAVIGLVPGIGSGRFVHDSGGNDHVRDARRGGVCLPPGFGGKIAACDSRLGCGTDQAFRSAGSSEDRSRCAGGDRTGRRARAVKLLVELTNRAVLVFKDFAATAFPEAIRSDAAGRRGLPRVASAPPPA